jgi:hypothetical protein
MEHLDSRRTEDGHFIGQDYLVDLKDAVAVQTSPFRSALEALRDLGLTQVIIDTENRERWIVTGQKDFPDTASLASDTLGGNLSLRAEILEDGERSLGIAFNGSEDSELDPQDLNERIWVNLELIHKVLSNSLEGDNIPIAVNPT